MKTINRSTAEELLQCNNNLLSESIQEEFEFAVESEGCANVNLQSDQGNSNKMLPMVITTPQKSQQKLPAAKKQDIFQKKLAEYDLKADQKGIYNIQQGNKIYITNFSQVSFLYRKIRDDIIIRVYSFNGVPIEFKPADLLSKNSFNKKLLGCSSFCVNLDKNDFHKLIDLLLSLDNGKTVEQTTGFGQVTPDIFHLGNKVIINGKISGFKDTIWIGDRGFSLNKTDKIKVTKRNDEFKYIWNYFYGLYGMQAILILGFAVATLFFQQFLKERDFFPLLYIRAASGRGKSCLAQLICSLFGLNDSLATINCAGNSTKVGIEEKSLLLNNLPLVLNEATEEDFSYLKSRYDGQGSVKYHPDKPGSILERSVNGSTIITTVVKPFDKQIISRCVFIDLDQIQMEKELFDKVRAKLEDLSVFAPVLLKQLSFKDILNEVDKCRDKYKLDIKEPRILDNYNLLAGCFNLFREKCDNDSLPTEAEVKSYIARKIKEAESYLNPLKSFIIELERLMDTKKAQDYILQDDNFLYFNFNSVWRAMNDSYKKKHFPFMTDANIKELLKDSNYIAVYGIDIAPKNIEDMGNPITNYVKRINSRPKRCFLLKNNTLPGFYR